MADPTIGGARISETKLDAEDLSTDTEMSTTCPDKKPIFSTSSQDSEWKLTPTQIDKWRRIAIAICVLSIATSIVLGILLFVVSVKESSSAAFGFGITAVLNSLTSCVVLWRYHGAFSAYSEKKEDRALIVLGILFIVSAICTIGKTIHNVVNEIKPDISEGAMSKLINVSIAATICFLIVSMLQFLAAKKLSSCTLLTDAINSLAGSIVALSLVMSARVSEFHPGYWYLDDVTAIIIGVALCIYGIVLLAKFIPALLRGRRYLEASK